MIGTKRLCFGIFWLISDSEDLEIYKLLCFKVQCDACGRVIEVPSIELNSKNGTNYNHKYMWDNHVKNNSSHKPYNKKTYNYYPRGRVEISNNKAVIYLNPYICRPHILDEIKAAFGLNAVNISDIKIIADNSMHYTCFINRNL